MAAKQNSKTSASEASSWRKIQQAGTRRSSAPRTRKGKRLIPYRIIGLAAVAGVAAAAILAGIGYLWHVAAAAEWSGQGEPLRRVYFETDGVLDDPWLQERLNLPQGINLMAVDIFAVQASLLEQGQTRSVEVERIFPDSLRVGIREHQPVLRLAARDASGERRIFLVSDQGVVYSGHNYPAAMLRNLPYLDGVVLRRMDNGRFQRLPQIPVIAGLISEARELHGGIFQQWSVVDSRDFNGDIDAPGALIRVRTRDYGEWVFAPADFNRQLQRLGLILEHAQQRELQAIQSIDLSFEEPVLATASAAAHESPAIRRR